MTVKVAASKIRMMDSEPKDEKGESTEQSTQEQPQKIPLSELRDLRPEKDPIGAGRQRPANSSSQFLH